MRTDIAIVGGGLVGIALACLLADPGRKPLSIAVIERRPPLPPGSEAGLRVSALSPASRVILSRCGAWQRLPTDRLGPYRRMTVWRNGGPDGPDSIHFDAAEQAADLLGHIVDNELLRYHLCAAAEAAGVQLITGTAPAGLRCDDDAARLELEDGRRLEARLMVGADGPASWLREQLGIVTDRRAYGQLGVVTHVHSERAHGETAWQRFLPEGPLALLPMADGRSSVVWSCSEADGRARLAMDADELGAELTGASQGVLGKLTVSAEAAAFPLAAAHARRYCQERFALVGDAAHQVHPLAGQGVNLGLLDAAALAAALADHLQQPGADPGDIRALRRYERSRRGDNLTTLAAMDALHRIFTGNGPIIAAAAGQGLGWIDHLLPVKRRLADRALGRGRAGSAV